MVGISDLDFVQSLPKGKVFTAYAKIFQKEKFLNQNSPFFIIIKLLKLL